VVSTVIFQPDLVDQLTGVSAKLAGLAKVRLVELIPVLLPDGTYRHLLLAVMRQVDFETCKGALAIASEGAVGDDSPSGQKATSLWLGSQTVVMRCLGFSSFTELCAGLGECEQVEMLFQAAEVGVMVA
jgi:hypothetical protein